jgi:hypothetical protein
LVTAPSNGASSAFVLTPLPNWLILLATELIAPTVLVITSRHRPHRRHRYSIVAFVSVAMGTCLTSHCPEMATAWTTENTVLLLLSVCMLQALPSNGCCLQSRCLATCVYTTI